MDYKGALVKGLKVIPSSSSIKLNPRQPQRKTNVPNWLNLPPDVMVLIMQRVDWFDVLSNVKEVCKYWHEISKDPWLWRFMEFTKDTLIEKIRKRIFGPTYAQVMVRPGYEEIQDKFERNVGKALEKIVMHVVDLSSGQLHYLCLRGFGSDSLLQYIYQRSSRLRRLRLEYCHVFSRDYYRHDFCISEGGLIGMLRNLPLLEELQFAYTSMPIKCIEVAGRRCSHLKSLSINQKVYYHYTGYPESDVEALAIAKHMPTLRHLQLFGNRMTSEGLQAILKNCNHLENLDLRLCYNLLKKDDFETELRQMIKRVRLPWDSTEDYEFNATIYDYHCALW